MNKIDSLLLNLKWEVERYENAGITEISEFKQAVEQAHTHYNKFVKKTGILNVISKSYTPGGY